MVNSEYNDYLINEERTTRVVIRSKELLESLNRSEAWSVILAMAISRGKPGIKIEMDCEGEFPTASFAAGLEKVRSNEITSFIFDNDHWQVCHLIWATEKDGFPICSILDSFPNLKHIKIVGTISITGKFTHKTLIMLQMLGEVRISMTDSEFRRTDFPELTSICVEIENIDSILDILEYVKFQNLRTVFVRGICSETSFIERFCRLPVAAQVKELIVGGVESNERISEKTMEVLQENAEILKKINVLYLSLFQIYGKDEENLNVIIPNLKSFSEIEEDVSGYFDNKNYL